MHVCDTQSAAYSKALAKMTRYVPTINPLVFVFLFLFVRLGVPELAADQRSTMIRLSDLLRGNPNTNATWNNATNPDPCSWNGVLCNPDNSSVIQLSLSRFSLSNPEVLRPLCQIGTLQTIDLSNNRLTSIPGEFIESCGGITGLNLLNFSRNELSGPLPTFQGFASLQFLDISYNSLSGNVHQQLDGLVELRSLNLSYNKLVGSVPVNLGRSMALEELQLSNNRLQGNIPQQIANYKNLSLIDFGANMLSGSIPDDFRNLSNLKFLILSQNHLSGGLPEFISTIRTLYRFAANQNNFIGSLPTGMTRYLSNLDLSYNHLNGSIPSDFLSNPSLQFVDLSHNFLEGSIPTNLSRSLVRLRLGGNSINGTIPQSFGNLQRLIYLELEQNKLTGSIPHELGYCQNLTLLNLAQNNLGGVLPAQLGNLINLREMKLQSNKLVGEIPSQIMQLNGLLRLNISWNSLSGSIPSSISNLQRLTNLNLQGNKLNGSIPNSIGNLKYLLELQLGMNQLNGVIPLMPVTLQISLNLSHNLFEGPIPRTFSRLTGLEVLDLSSNRFSGEIPEFLTGMSSLTQLILSNNQLSGFIPKFKPYVMFVSSGNKDLINTTTLQSPPASTRKRKSVAVGVVVGVAVAVGLAIGVVALVALLISRRFYRINDEQLQPEERIVHTQVVQGNMLCMNGIHRSHIDFAKAMEAVTDPTNIVLKTRFSTYYKVIMPSGMNYFAKKLNWSDKIFQLGSHEKFEEELQVLGKLSNSNVMTPLAYVLTVDSAYLFYEFAEKGTLFDVLLGKVGDALDWESRYSIAIGVAQGLAFLHGCASGPILLLDLSSKSILLKSPKEPQVGDIELCKVIDPSKSTGSLSTIAGSVGYVPPEYAYTMRVTTSGNVYSFGVILLELLTGKPAVSEGTELAKWVLNNAGQHGKRDHILDFRVGRRSPMVQSQMLAVLKVALACVSVSPEARPKIKTVLRMLLNAR